MIGYAHIGGDWRDGYELEAFAKVGIRGRKEFEELFPGIGLPDSLPEAIRRAGGAPPKSTL